MQIISKHINNSMLKAQIHQINSICAFSGKKITEGILLKDCISDVFTDHEYIKHKSKYVSLDYAKCILDTIQGTKGTNALRSYSYFATETELRFLKRDEILDLILNIPETPFRLAVSYNYKKHTSYKTILNTSKNTFTITTDLYNVIFNRKHVEKFLPIIQNWYSIIPEKSTTSALPTFFTKDEIMNGNAAYHKTKVYGLDKFEEENEFLQKFRDTQIFNFITHLLNKKLC